MSQDARPLAESTTTTMQTFETGATRETNKDKLDYEACLSPLVLKAYAEYKRKHRVQSDGVERADDNWQKGVPLNVYMKSMWRHFMDIWLIHRGWYSYGAPMNKDMKGAMRQALCALLFNVMGYLHELERDSFTLGANPEQPKGQLLEGLEKL